MKNRGIAAMRLEIADRLEIQEGGYESRAYPRAA